MGVAVEPVVEGVLTRPFVVALPLGKTGAGATLLGAFGISEAEALRPLMALLSACEFPQALEPPTTRSIKSEPMGRDKRGKWLFTSMEDVGRRPNLPKR